MSQEPHKFGRVIENLIACFRLVPEDGSKSRPRETKGNALPIEVMVDELMAKHKIGQETVEHRLRDKWQSIVGPGIAGYTNPAEVSPDGTLWIWCSHSVARSEIQNSWPIILDRVRMVSGCSHVKRLYFKNG